MAQTKRIERVINQLEKLPTMSALERRDFADEGGYADEVVRAFGENQEGRVSKDRIKDALKPTQLRKVFHALKAVQVKVKRTGKFDRGDILRITPELAYATGRGLLPRDFYQLVKTCTSPERLKSADDFLKAFELLEAILAYHKYRSEIGY
jgi:CRISPR-associated protein Csm2